jgi:hypothetical protein
LFHLPWRTTVYNKSQTLSIKDCFICLEGQLYITNHRHCLLRIALKETWKCALYELVTFISMFKLFVLLINLRNETILNRQWYRAYDGIVPSWWGYCILSSLQKNPRLKGSHALLMIRITIPTEKKNISRFITQNSTI